MGSARAAGAAVALIEPTLEDDVRALLRVAAVAVAPVVVGPSSPALRAEIERTAERLRADHAAVPPASIPALAPARELYRAFGIDPTKLRPSSESLLRRVLRGESLPSISNAVDACNLLAVRFLLPLGLYDPARIDPPVVLRRGRAGETYPGIRKELVHLAGRPVLADARGAFGNPTSDSARSAVSSATTALWLVIFAPRSFPTQRLDAHAAEARRVLAGLQG